MNLKDIEDKELAVVAAIYCKRYPEHVQDILELISSISKKKKEEKKYDTLFNPFLDLETAQSARETCDNLYKIISRNNKLVYDYFATSNAHNKKKQERLSKLQQEGLAISDLKVGGNLAKNIDSMGLSSVRVVKLKEKIKKLEEEFQEKLEKVLTTLGKDSLPYFSKGKQ